MKLKLSTTELKDVQDAVQAKLQERATIREEKARRFWRVLHFTYPTQALLHLLLKVSESVQRLESLLLLPSPPDESTLDSVTNGYTSPTEASNTLDRPNAFTATEDDGAEDQCVSISRSITHMLIPELQREKGTRQTRRASWRRIHATRV